MIGGDSDDEMRRAKIWFFCLVVYIMTGWIAWTELDYFVWGKSADAEILSVTESYSTGRYGRRHPNQNVEFSFTEANGTHRTERETVDIYWQAPGSGQTKIEYFAGIEYSARIAGVAWKFPAWIFLAMTVIGIIFAIRLWRHASEMVEGMSKPGQPPSKKQRSSGRR